MAFTKYEFTKSWLSSTDFPTYEANETKVREDMQVLHDETRDAVHALVDELEAGTAAESIGAVNENGETKTVQQLLLEIINHITIDPDAIKDVNVGLSDDVIAALQLVGTLPNAEDAFLRLAEMTQDLRKVGDVLSTARGNPGGGWLSCDGSAVRAADYPELAALLAEPANVKVGGNSTIRRVAGDGNGNYVAIGATADQMYYATTPAGPWTKITLTDTTSAVVDVTYGNGTWAVLGYGTSGGEKQYFTFSAATPGGAWTKGLIVLPETLSGYNTAFTRIAYGGGAWQILGYKSPGHLDLLQAATLGTTWTHVELFAGVGAAWSTEGNLIHAGEVMFACGVIRDNNGKVSAKLFARADDSSAWQQEFATDALAAMGVMFRCAFFAQPGVGSMLALVSSAPGTAPTKIYSGNPPTMTLAATLTDSAYGGNEANLGYAGGTWLLTFGNGYLASATIPTSWNGETGFGGGLYDLLVEGDRWMCGSQISDEGYVITTLATSLPSITTPGVNTYIKAQ